MTGIKYGISKFTVGAFTIEHEEGRAGPPVSIPGIVGLALEPESISEAFKVDGLPVWSGEVFNGYGGALTGALFISPLQEAVLTKGERKQRSYIAFETSGSTPERILLYNVAFAFPETEHATISAQEDPDTETLQLVCVGDNDTGITMVNFKEGDRFYDQIFTDPPDPADLVTAYLQDENYADITDENGAEILVKRPLL